MKKYFKKILFVCLLCTLTLCLFVGGKTLKVKADETYNFANITEEESLEFLADHNIEIPAIFRNNVEKIGLFTKDIIDTVINNPNCSFSFNYDKTLNFANDIKQAVLQNINAQTLSNLISTSYSLQYNTVKNAEGEWVTQGGAWNDKWLNYNCYAFAINRNEQPAFYNTGRQYQPGDMTPGNDNFFTVGDISGLANLVKRDLEEMNYQNVTVSTTIPEITNTHGLICVRKNEADYHFMKYDLLTDSWYHKPGETAILKYNGVPNNSQIWYSEISSLGYESRSFNDYNSDIYFIKYSKNIADISSQVTLLSCNMDINTQKDSILEIQNTSETYYKFNITSVHGACNPQLLDNEMELLQSFSASSKIEFFRYFSLGTFYIKINFINPYACGSAIVGISVHNHQLAYQNNSSNHRETCSVCGYDEVVSHSYTNSYARYNSAQHTAYCACGASKVENHSYTARYTAGATDTTHMAYCACGASISESHDYSKKYVRIDGYLHNAFCYCGAFKTQGHYVVSGAKPPYKCIYCKGLADEGLSQMKIIPIGAVYITANGTYVLPSGIIVLSDADYQGYLNGTFVIPHCHDVAA